MSNKTLVSRIREALDFYIALKNEEALAHVNAMMPAKPSSSFGGSYAGNTVAVGRRKRRSQKVAPGGPGQELSPAEDTQNIMNGLLARVAGNTEPDGS